MIHRAQKGGEGGGGGGTPYISCIQEPITLAV